MTRGKFRALLILTAALLVLALICAIAAGKSFKNEKEQQPDPDNAPPSIIIETPEPSGSPSYSGQTAAPSYTPAPTSKPAQTPTPAATPAPTPTPTPAPTPTPVYGQLLKSGSLRSDTGTAINIIADYSVVSVDASTVQVTVKVSLQSQSLISRELPGSVTIRVSSNDGYLGSPEINHESNDVLYTEFGSKTFTVSAPSGSTTDIPISVSWAFGGVYSGQDLSTIDCKGSCVVSR